VPSVSTRPQRPGPLVAVGTTGPPVDPGPGAGARPARSGLALGCSVIAALKQVNHSSRNRQAVGALL
jgi:hypothetical protein